MKKEQTVVGIVTIDDYTNYGNRLQNFALTKLLENEGVRVINGIRVVTRKDWIHTSRSGLKRLVKRMIPFDLMKRRIGQSFENRDPLKQERLKNFSVFNRLYSNIIPPIIEKTGEEALLRLEKYGISFYVTGSDQVWNPYFGGKEYEFLTFAPTDKRLSFSASFGVEEIPDFQKERFRHNLNQMRYISVREKSAVDLVRSLCGREADLTYDPTLLLPIEEYEKITVRPEFDIPDHYVCTYFLGELPKEVKAFAKKKGLEVLPLNDSSRREIYNVDPSRFLYLIRHADYILTDSFHAAVFAIRFHRQFLVFRRQQEGVCDMFTRLGSLLEELDLTERVLTEEEFNGSHITEQNWNAIDRKLEEQRRRSVGMLMDMFIADRENKCE